MLPSKEPLPAEREPKEAVYRSFANLSNKTLISEILDAIPNICIIINRGRQIVFANRALMEFIGTTDRFSACGLRLGEALRCVHSGETRDGCGATEFCETCGAVEAILSAAGGHGGTQECRITRDDGQVLDLRVRTTPMSVEGTPYTVMTVTDVSDEKRRRVLERVFFHDILNTAGAIRGFCELFSRRPPEEFERLRDRIHRLSTRLIEEINAQKELTDAENGELSVNLAEIATNDLLLQIVDQFAESENPDTPFVQIDPASEPLIFRNDPALLRRVIGNLLKNAIEASRQGDIVTLGSYRSADTVEFRIHNQGSMSRNVRLQVFQRSFSTKGVGRGLGTYSAKLLTEHYLKGKIGFRTSRESGTTFSVSYPLDPGTSNENGG
jgi:signal transduction histidine kinase